MSAAPRRERTDEELLALARRDPDSQASREAASALLDRYQGRVYLWCRRLVRDHERALELAQDALLSAYRRLDSFGGRASFSSWLFAITRNCCLSAMRRPALLEEEGTEPEALGDSSRAPDRVFEEKEGEESILGLIRQHLAPQEQEVLWLRCFERLPVEEITQLLGIGAASGARGVLQTARRKLRSALAERRRLEGEGSYG